MATQKPERTIEVYADESGRWRWKARGRNGKVTAASAESFHSKGNAKKAAERERVAWLGGVVILYA